MSRKPFLIWLTLLLPPQAWSEPVDEYAVKAAFLYNFSAFTEWPASIGSQLNLCIYGRDVFGQKLDKLNGKKIGNRSLAVQRDLHLENAHQCQVVFISANKADEADLVLEAIGKAPVLTIGDSDDLARQGVIINMQLADNKVTFDINNTSAKRAGLTLSSKLLQLATTLY